MFINAAVVGVFLAALGGMLAFLAKWSSDRTDTELVSTKMIGGLNYPLGIGMIGLGACMFVVGLVGGIAQWLF